MKRLNLAITTTVFVFIYTFLTSLSVYAESDGLVLWNTLGSESEYENSEYGPGFSIVRDGGDVLPVSGKYGGALSTTGGTRNLDPSGGYLSMNPDDFYPAKLREQLNFGFRKRRMNLYRTKRLY